MNIKVNTNEKTITILSCINIGELIIELEKLFPDGGWMEYHIFPEIQNTGTYNPNNIRLIQEDVCRSPYVVNC